MIVDVGTKYHVDPVVLLARMQVEHALVSATTRPDGTRLKSALGCACPVDDSTCFGLANQLRCAAKTLASGFDNSQHGTGPWTVGKLSSTLDHVRVTPRTDATAALYAYSPWVKLDEGGNWLLWNVTRRFLKHFDAAGVLQLQ